MDKIWESILQKGLQINANEFIEYGRKCLPKNYIVGSNKSKLHTIRVDESNRWKTGMDIHFVINNRTPQRFQFAPVVKCTGDQKIEILYSFPDNLLSAFPRVFVDGVWLPDATQLAINDGFNSVEDFFAWFNKDFTGKIIHWTDLRY